MGGIGWEKKCGDEEVDLYLEVCVVYGGGFVVGEEVLFEVYLLCGG